MELNYSNLVATRSGYDFEFATTERQVRMRVRIHADKSYPVQSYAVGEVWMANVGWVECATLLVNAWATWGSASPTQNGEVRRCIDEAHDELMARMAATLNL